MPNLRQFLTYRVLISLTIAALLFGEVMLHPYPRQSLFGPRFHGKPWWKLIQIDSTTALPREKARRITVDVRGERVMA